MALPLRRTRDEIRLGHGDVAGAGAEWRVNSYSHSAAPMSRLDVQSTQQDTTGRVAAAPALRAVLSEMEWLRNGKRERRATEKGKEHGRPFVFPLGFVSFFFFSSSGLRCRSTARLLTLDCPRDDHNVTVVFSVAFAR